MTTSGPARAVVFACCLGAAGAGLAQEPQTASTPVRPAAETAPAEAAPIRAAMPQDRKPAEQPSEANVLSAIKIYPSF